MNRIAYIISAHKDAPHLARLVAALDDRADFYVHVDLKADIRPFKEALGNKATFVPRHWVSWGGWEQVEYQKELLAAVVRSGIPYTRVVCLSGLDYPLWPNGEIHRYFDTHRDTEFIAGMNVTRCDNKGQRRKIVRYHFFRDLKWNNLWLKNKPIVASRWLMKILPFRKRSWLRTGDGRKAEVYVGSDWWALTLPCARYVHNALCTDYALLKSYFKTSFAPASCACRPSCSTPPSPPVRCSTPGSTPAWPR